MPKTPDESISFSIRPGASAQAAQGLRAAEFTRICTSVCELAAALFDMPLSVLKLYEGARLVTAAAFGTDDIASLETFTFTERKLAGKLTVTDATRDGRFFLEPAVLRGPRIRFYTDMPLIHDGVVIGVLALAEPLPRHDFAQQKLELLEKFAGLAATLIYLAQNAQQRSDMIGELQAKQSRMDSAADMTGLGYWKIDLKTREVTWSSGLYAIFGLSPKHYKPDVATQLEMYEPEDRATLIDRFQAAVNNGEDFDFQLQIMRRKDKTMRLIRTRGGVETDADGTPARLCAVVCDVTGDKAETVKPTEAPRPEPLTGLADALRAPLNDIIRFARLIETQPASGAEIATYTHSLLARAQALQGLLGDTPVQPAPAMEMADTLSGDEEVVDVADVIRETVNSFSARAEAGRTRLTVHFTDLPRGPARLDVMRIQQVLQNLIANACKFTRGGAIAVTASQVRAQNPLTFAPQSRLHVSVRDSGPGMSEEKAQALLQGNGAGLGLSVVRTIVDMLGGTLGIVSRPGEGANVWFEIPVAWVDAPGAPVADPKAAPVPRTLTRQTFDGPAYAPSRPRIEPRETPRYVPVDEDRINREYLRALLHDMKLDIQ